MKETIKKIACAALCAVMLFCMAAPAFALTGSENHSHIDYGDGVRVTCVSTLTTNQGKSKLTLGFVDNVAHMPESDYTSIATVVITLNSSNTVSEATVSAPGLSATATATIGSGFYATCSVHTYCVNSTDNQVHSKTFGTP